jgi:hypothetical protein
MARDSELLGAGIQVMKVQSSKAAVIAADPTAAPGLQNQGFLHTPAADHNRLPPAPSASVVAPRLTHVIGLAMARTEERRVGQPGLASLTRPLTRSSPPATGRLQTVLRQPMSHPRAATPECLGDFSDGSAVVYERLQDVSGNTSLAGVLGLIDRPEPMLHRPVPDGAFVQVNAPSDLCK